MHRSRLHYWQRIYRINTYTNADQVLIFIFISSNRSSFSSHLMMQTKLHVTSTIYIYTFNHHLKMGHRFKPKTPAIVAACTDGLDRWPGCPGRAFGTGSWQDPMSMLCHDLVPNVPIAIGTGSWHGPC